MKNYLVTVKGKVQGVFFRKSTKEKADELGLTGWVMNENNGDVSITIEGKEVDCFSMLDWLKNGSPRSTVSSLFIEKKELENYLQFNIR